SLEGARAREGFVEQDQTARGSAMKDGREPLGFEVQPAEPGPVLLAVREVGVDRIHWTQAGRAGGHVHSGLKQHLDQADCAGVGRFAAAVWAWQDPNPA